MRLEKVRSISGISVIVGTWCRYSWRAVSRPANPSCQPSIIASANAHPHDVAQVTSLRTRHDNRCARPGPHSTAAIPMAAAAMLPQPDMGFPPAENWCGVSVIVDLLRRAVDQRSDDAQAQVRHHKSRYDQCDAQRHRDGFATSDLHHNPPMVRVLARATTTAPSCRRLTAIVCSCCQRQHRCEGRSGPRGARRRRAGRRRPAR